jgi:formylglycine-generating enzyme required for sulfatase activity
MRELEDARAFADWLNATGKGKVAGWTYRLPTEAEWEYAARGPQSLQYPWGNAWDATRCNFGAKGLGISREEVDDGYPRTAPVGSFSPKGDSPFGLSDMAGNVSEWCLDWYGPYKEGDQTDPTGPPPPVDEDRVLRGGSWFQDRCWQRTTDRGYFEAALGGNCIGFRLVLAPGPP